MRSLGLAGKDSEVVEAHYAGLWARARRRKPLVEPIVRVVLRVRRILRGEDQVRLMWLTTVEATVEKIERATEKRW